MRVETPHIGFDHPCRGRLGIHGEHAFLDEHLRQETLQQIETNKDFLIRIAGVFDWLGHAEQSFGRVVGDKGVLTIEPTPDRDCKSAPISNGRSSGFSNQRAAGQGEKFHGQCRGLLHRQIRESLPQHAGELEPVPRKTGPDGDVGIAGMPIDDKVGIGRHGVEADDVLLKSRKSRRHALLEELLDPHSIFGIDFPRCLDGICHLLPAGVLGDSGCAA
jgi:hypothetical protein